MFRRAGGNWNGKNRRPPPSGLKSVTSDEFIAREVDPILDKMNAKQSLTERERRILEQAGKRINKR